MQTILKLTHFEAVALQLLPYMVSLTPLFASMADGNIPKRYQWISEGTKGGEISKRFRQIRVRFE